MTRSIMRISSGAALAASLLGVASAGLGGTAGATTSAPGCSQVLRRMPLPSGVSVTVGPYRTTVSRGSNFGGVFTVKNDGTKPFSYDFGVANGDLLTSATATTVAGTYRGIVAAVLAGGTVQPGKSRREPFLAGTETCSGGNVPAGHYEVVVQLGNPSARPGQRAYYVSAGAGIQVVDAGSR